MRLSKTEKMLKEAGFQMVRDSTHRFWRYICHNGIHLTFATHRGSKQDHREEAHARSVIRRAQTATASG